MGVRSDQSWYAEGLKFRCTQCGDCCSGAPGFVWVNKEEIVALARQVGMADDIEGFEQKYVRKVGMRKSLIEYPDGDCIFLDSETRRCLVYDSRPIQCRTWPFWNSNLKSPETWKEAASACPGCNRGKVYSFQEIETQRLKKSV